MPKKRAKVKRKSKVEKSVRWLPAPYKGAFQVVDGEPCRIGLTNFKGDNSVRGDLTVTCCGCDFEHLLLFEIIKVEGEYVLTVRFHANESTRPRKAKVKPRPRRKGKK